MKLKSLLAWLLLPLLLLAGRPANGQEQLAKTQPPKHTDAPQASPPKFIRVKRDDSNQPLAMETAVVRFTGGNRPGVSIDLVGAVHIADQAYYDELNKLFASYDVVLYELVAPEGTKVPKGGRQQSSGHPIGAMQDGMSSLLALRHQLDCVDYSKPNFVHADMSPDEFNKTMEQRGEGFFQMFLRMMGQSMAHSATGAGAGGASDLGLLMALFSRDRATKLKTIMAEQFENLEGSLAAIDGPEGSTIITERNKKCFAVLDQQLQAGKKSIAIFYGAGHFPDMEKRLAADYGLERASEQWLTAWRLQK